MLIERTGEEKCLQFVFEGDNIIKKRQHYQKMLSKRDDNIKQNYPKEETLSNNERDDAIRLSMTQPQDDGPLTEPCSLRHISPGILHHHHTFKLYHSASELRYIKTETTVSIH